MRAKKFAVVLSCLFIFSSSFLFRRQARLLSLSVLWLLDWQQGMMDRSGMSRICILSQNPSAAKNRRDPFGQQFLYFRFRITWQSYCGDCGTASRGYIFSQNIRDAGYFVFHLSFHFDAVSTWANQPFYILARVKNPSEKISEFLRHELDQSFPLTVLL